MQIAAADSHRVHRDAHIVHPEMVVGGEIPQRQLKLLLENKCLHEGTVEIPQGDSAPFDESETCQIRNCMPTAPTGRGHDKQRSCVKPISEELWCR